MTETDKSAFYGDDVCYFKTVGNNYITPRNK